MTLNFLIGAVLGSAFAVFGMGAPVRRLVQTWHNHRAKKRGD